MPKANPSPYNADQRKQHPVKTVPVPIPKQIRQARSRERGAGGVAVTESLKDPAPISGEFYFLAWKPREIDS
jgi:hypothetical protein